jgi:hypothetical protein
MLPKLVIVIMYYEIHGSLGGDLSFKVTYGDENNLVAEFPVLRKDIISEQGQAPSTQSREDSERIYKRAKQGANRSVYLDPRFVTAARGFYSWSGLLLAVLPTALTWLRRVVFWSSLR